MTICWLMWRGTVLQQNFRLTLKECRNVVLNNWNCSTICKNSVAAIIISIVCIWKWLNKLSVRGRGTNSYSIVSLESKLIVGIKRLHSFCCELFNFATYKLPWQPAGKHNMAQPSHGCAHGKNVGESLLNFV